MVVDTELRDRKTRLKEEQGSTRTADTRTRVVSDLPVFSMAVSKYIEEKDENTRVSKWASQKGGQ